MKTLRMIAKPDKESFVPPRKVQDLIPIKRIWADGIFQVGATRWSRVWKLSDINYQVAGQEERETMQRDYQAMLDSLEIGCSGKIIVMNRKMNPEQFAQEVLLAMAGDDLDEYRTELNDVLLGQTSGGTGIIQQRYITVSIQRKTLEEARVAFQRIGAALYVRFHQLGSHCTELDAAERCRLLHDFFRNNEESIFHFDLKEMQRQGQDFRDYICPDSAEQNKDYMMLGNQYARVLWIKSYANKVRDDILYEFMELNRKLLVTIDIIPVSNEDALRETERKLMGVETSIARWQQKQIQNNNITSVIPYDMEKQQLEVRGKLDEIISQDQRMFMMSITLVHMADSKEQLDLDTEALCTRARERGCQMGVLRYQQMDGLQSALPIGVRKIGILRPMTTHEVAIFMPYRVQEVQDQGGLYYGVNAISGNLILANRDNLKNQSGMIFGVPGGGKSFIAKEMLTDIILSTDDDVIICDPEREYELIAKALHGEVIHISASSTHHINPMDMEEDYGEGRDSMADKVEFVLSLFEQLVRRGGQSIDWAKAQSIIDRSCCAVYDDYKRGGQMPTLSALRDKLLAQPEKEAQDLALYLERFTSGTQGVFARETNVDTQNRLIVYDILDLGEQLKTLGLLIITDAMINRVTRNWKQGKKTHIIIDEFHVMMENEHSAAFFDSAWRRFRKRGGYPTAITQNVDTLLESAQSRAMISNSEFLVMLSQSDTDRQRLGELLHITDTQLQYVKNVPSGCGLLKYGDSLIPFRNQFPQNTKLYHLMTTKPGEGVRFHGAEATAQT